MRRCAALILAILAAAMSGCSTPAPPASCGDPLLAQAKSARDLRAIKDRCPQDLDAQAKALARLNALPPSPVRSAAPGQANVPGQMERVTWELDSFFYVLEGYPPEEALAKLEDLVGRISATHKVEAVSVIGRREAAEPASLAQARAEFIRDYLARAGIPVALITVSTTPPADAATPEARALSRSVRTRLVVVRQKRAPGQ